ncbi:hypothetical protein LTR16_000899 [Cryomyces antarcticus]|uniref:Glycosyltransferase 2-like domain-containing protein n=1 Tax=Cryomyces antarcticus TaxID=329879 RepID=A0ABR0KUJ6_9PEZI|nr:hypothetical protein LTR39_000613 [Cryomyces antarcticus]KAK5131281.1 hypothetical protein LTR16_000899 [Cryomyces antarcticus]
MRRLADFGNWCVRCCVSFSLVALWVLIYFALWNEPHLSARRPHSIGDDGPVNRGNRHLPGSRHDHGNAVDLSTHWRLLFVFYIVLVHVLGLVVPVRACWAVWSTTKGLKKAAFTRRPRAPLAGANAPFKLAQYSPAFSLPSRSSSAPSKDTYDADDGLSEATVIYAIIVPNYKEDIDTLRETLKVLACHPQASSCYDVYVAMEQREAEATDKATKLTEEFLSAFRNISYTLHPGEISGESPGKSSNESWAAVQACRRYSLREGQKSRRDVIFTVMDADSHLSQRYFALITEMHLEYPHTADTTIYVPPIVFDRNSNSVPALVRVADLLWCGAGLSGQYSSSAIRPPTSVYSLSLSLVERVGGWDTGPEAIGEDLHMYLKCFFALSGNLTTRTVFSAASQSNVHSDRKGIRGTVATLRARYKQAKRHMWGALDTGYAVRRSFQLCWYGNSDDGEPRWRETGLTQAQLDVDYVRSADITSSTLLTPFYESSSDIAPPAPSTHWPNMIVLFHRLYEAHFLPVHLGTLVLSSLLYTATRPASAIPASLLWAFQVTAYLRTFSALGIIRLFTLYEDYHRTCVRTREEEMQRAGLAQRMRGSFVKRKFWPNVCDYALFPVSGMLFGSVPAMHAQICHFWTVDLTYTVSKKPQRKGVGPEPA